VATTFSGQREEARQKFGQSEKMHSQVRISESEIIRGVHQPASSNVNSSSFWGKRSCR